MELKVEDSIERVKVEVYELDDAPLSLLVEVGIEDDVLSDALKYDVENKAGVGMMVAE